MSVKTQLENAEVALELWRTVLPEAVSPKLEKWRCGTQACFGGWLTKQEHFRSQGLRGSDFTGEPYLKSEAWTCPTTAARVLFGNYEIFFARGNTNNCAWSAVERDHSVSDHEVVIHRLQWQIAHLKMQAV